MCRDPGSRSIFEDDIKVGELKQLLRAEGARKEDILQFWEPRERVHNGFVRGRLRTIAVDDIVEVR